MAIQINITEASSPQNVATIDRPDLNLEGNTFSKEQTKEEIQNAKISGIVGNATESNAPTSWTNGDPNLYESWKVIEPISTSSSWYALADTENKEKFPITQSDLDDNYISFEVNNGVVTVFPTVKISGDDGKSAYEIAVDNGFVGTETDWLESLGGSVISPVFDQFTDTEAQGGKQIADWISDNTIKYFENEVISIFYTGYMNNGTFVSDGGFRTTKTILADNITKVILNGKERLSTQGIKTLIGKLVSDSTFEVIHDVPAAVMTDLEVDIEFGKYSEIYFNTYGNTPPIGITLVRQFEKTIYAEPNDIVGLEEIKEATQFFTKTTSTDSADNWAANFYVNNGVSTFVGASQVCIYPIDGTDVIALKLTMNTPGSASALQGKRVSDGGWDTLVSFPTNTVLVDYVVNVEKNKYSVFAGNAMSANTHIIEFVKEIPVKDIKEYGDANWGGTGGGISANSSIIFAENYGVSASNTATDNTTALNSLFATHKDTGVAIHLPVGEIRVNAVLNIYNTTPLIGSGWGSDITSGTRLVFTTSNSYLNVQQNGTDNHRSATIKEIFFYGNSVAAKGLVLGAGVAFGMYENLAFSNFTNVAVQTVGALIYTFKNCNFIQSPNGISIANSTLYNANLIKLESCRFTTITNIAVNISVSANIVFDFCDFEAIGTTGNVNTGVVNASNLSGLGEGVDLSFRNCWSEIIRGGFWLKLALANGTTTFKDTMLWTAGGDCQKGIINNGSKVLIEGSTKIQGFVTGVETSNSGQTKLNGFATVGTHTELTGGTFKTATYS